MSMEDVGVSSVTDESSEFALITRSGGCVYTDGYFRVDGNAMFTRCDVSGGGESSSGPGGALYVGEQGSVLFNGEVEISSVSITDDEGGDGGGIYNKGKVDIKEDAKFNTLRAREGGALCNGAGAQFIFTSQATVVFIDCRSYDGIGGALYNQGNFKFSGPALFFEQDEPTIYVGPTDKTVFSENLMFWDNDSKYDPAILVASGGVLDIPNSVLFVDDVESDCSTVYYKEDETCL